MAEWVSSEGVRLYHPNREKGASKVTKAIVILLLLVSVALMIIQTIGGWDKLEGMQQVQIAFILLYLVFAFFVARWNRGALPISAAFAIMLLIFAAITGPGWFARDQEGFSDPALDESIVGVITLLLVPVQILLIGFAMRGFQQAWNVEEEVPGQRRDYDSPQHGAPATA